MKYFCVLPSNSQKYCISIGHNHCCLIVLLTMPTVVVLSMWIGVGGCGWPSLARISQRTLASCALRNRAPNSTSAAEAATSLSIVHVMWIVPLSFIGSLSVGRLPRKK